MISIIIMITVTITITITITVTITITIMIMIIVHLSFGIFGKGDILSLVTREQKSDALSCLQTPFSSFCRVVSVTSVLAWANLA